MLPTGELFKVSSPLLLQDYPSPGLVRDVLLESQVVPIFAVASKEKQVYEVRIKEVDWILKNMLIISN